MSLAIPQDLRTSRFSIRPHRESDIDPFAEFLSDADSTRFLGLTDEKRTVESARSRLGKVIASYQCDDPTFFLAVEDGESEVYVGSVGLHALTDGGFAAYYNVQPDWQGRGVATEATAAIIKWAFEVLDAERIEAHVFPENIASVRVAQKLGFSLQGSHVHQGRKGQRYVLHKSGLPGGEK